jgi:hypothetical protein
VHGATWFCLTEAAAIATAASLPYGAQLSGRRTRPPQLLNAFLRSQPIYAVVVAAGLLLGTPLGLGAPGLDAFWNSFHVALSAGTVLASGLEGIAAAMLCWGLDIVAFRGARMSLVASGVRRPSVWARGGAVLYGAVAEEIMVRLGVLTILAAALALAVSRPLAVRIGIALSALVFGLGHLPATSRVAPLTTSLVTRAIVLNGIGGLVFGEIYVVQGLLHAIFAHACADVVLQFWVPAWRRRDPARLPR